MAFNIYATSIREQRVTRWDHRAAEDRVSAKDPLKVHCAPPFASPTILRILFQLMVVEVASPLEVAVVFGPLHIALHIPVPALSLPRHQLYDGHITSGLVLFVRFACSATARDLPRDPGRPPRQGQRTAVRVEEILWPSQCHRVSSRWLSSCSRRTP